MSDPLAWYNVIFYIPLVFGMLLVIGAALGLGHGDPDADVDADADADADVHAHGELGKPDGGHGHDAGHHGETSFLQKVFSLFGVGRVPLTIIMMLMCFIFGGTGIILNALLGFLPAWLYAPASIAGASLVTLALTGKLAKLVARMIPTTETYRVSKYDLVGTTGELMLPADETSGTAQVKDPRGNVHNISCRSPKGRLKEGEGILVIDYDENADVYTVERYSPDQDERKTIA